MAPHGFSASDDELKLADRLLDATKTWQRTDTLSLDSAIGIFQQSEISFKQLHKIWSLADEDGTGHLSKDELTVVIRLMGWVQAGSEVSERLLEQAGPLPTLKGINDNAAHNLGVAKSDPLPAATGIVNESLTHKATKSTPRDQAEYYRNDDKVRFERRFKHVCKEGRVNRMTAKETFLNFSLSDAHLEGIIDLVAGGGCITLGIHEFMLFMHIVEVLEYERLSPIPSTIPLSIHNEVARMQACLLDLQFQPPSRVNSSSPLIRVQTPSPPPSPINAEPMLENLPSLSPISSPANNQSKQTSEDEEDTWDRHPLSEVIELAMYRIRRDLETRQAVEGNLLAELISEYCPPQEVQDLWKLAIWTPNGQISQDDIDLTVNLTRKWCNQDAAQNSWIYQLPLSPWALTPHMKNISGDLLALPERELGSDAFTDLGDSAPKRTPRLPHIILERQFLPVADLHSSEIVLESLKKNAEDLALHARRMFMRQMEQKKEIRLANTRLKDRVQSLEIQAHALHTELSTSIPMDIYTLRQEQHMREISRLRHDHQGCEAWLTPCRAQTVVAQDDASNLQTIIDAQQKDLEDIKKWLAESEKATLKLLHASTREVEIGELRRIITYQDSQIDEFLSAAKNKSRDPPLKSDGPQASTSSQTYTLLTPPKLPLSDSKPQSMHEPANEASSTSRFSAPANLTSTMSPNYPSKNIPTNAPKMTWQANHPTNVRHLPAALLPTNPNPCLPSSWASHDPATSEPLLFNDEDDERDWQQFNANVAHFSLQLEHERNLGRDTQQSHSLTLQVSNHHEQDVVHSKVELARQEQHRGPAEVNLQVAHQEAQTSEQPSIDRLQRAVNLLEQRVTNLTAGRHSNALPPTPMASNSADAFADLTGVLPCPFFCPPSYEESTSPSEQIAEGK